MFDPAPQIRNCRDGGIVLYAWNTILDSLGETANGRVVRKVAKICKWVGYIAIRFQLLQEYNALWGIMSIHNHLKEASAHNNLSCICSGHPDKSVVSFERSGQCLNIPMLKEN